MKTFQKILLIDDDEVSNIVTKSKMKSIHLCEQVQTAINGKQGLELVISSLHLLDDCPDLILLDINMPVMDGFEFLQKYHMIDSPTKPFIVMFSSSEDPRDKEKAFQFEKVVGYIDKPLTEDKILPIVNALQANERPTL